MSLRHSLNRNRLAVCTRLTGAMIVSLAATELTAQQRSDRSWARGPVMGATLEAESVDDVPLSRIWGMAVDSQGRVYIEDALAGGVIALAPDLTHLYTLGRQGEGPGEFRAVSTVTVMRGDSVSVYDGILSRITVYGPGSVEPAYVQRIPGRSYQDVHRVSNGLVAIRSPAYEASGSDIAIDSSWLVHLRSDGSIAVDSLFSFPRRDNLVLRTSDGRGGGTVSMSSNPFGHEPFVRVLDGDSLKAVYSSSVELAVTTINLETGARTSFSHSTERLEVTRPELAAELAKQSDRFRRILRDSAPPAWPPVVGMVARDAGLILLGLRKPDRTIWEWALFRADGAHLGSITLPAGFVVHAMRDGRFVGSIVGETGVPVVRAYRMTSDTLQMPLPATDSTKQKVGMRE